MKAPDKIYVSIPTRLQSDSPKYVGIAWNDKGNITTPQIEEYIRKEALLEWAKEHLLALCTTEEEEFSYEIEKKVYKSFINKLNSM